MEKEVVVYLTQTDEIPRAFRASSLYRMCKTKREITLNTCRPRELWIDPYHCPIDTYGIVVRSIERIGDGGYHIHGRIQNYLGLENVRCMISIPHRRAANQTCYFSVDNRHVARLEARA